MSCNFNDVLISINFCFAASILNLPIQLLSVNTNAAGKIGQFLWRMTTAIFSQNVSWVTLGGNHFSLDYKPENLYFSYFEFFIVSFTKSYVQLFMCGCSMYRLDRGTKDVRSIQLLITSFTNSSQYSTLKIGNNREGLKFMTFSITR